MGNKAQGNTAVQDEEKDKELEGAVTRFIEQGNTEKEAVKGIQKKLHVGAANANVLPAFGKFHAFLANSDAWQ